jgi:hypothetical protein
MFLFCIPKKSDIFAGVCDAEIISYIIYVCEVDAKNYRGFLYSTMNMVGFFENSISSGRKKYFSRLRLINTFLLLNSDYLLERERERERERDSQ